VPLGDLLLEKPLGDRPFEIPLGLLVETAEEPLAVKTGDLVLDVPGDLAELVLDGPGDLVGLVLEGPGDLVGLDLEGPGDLVVFVLVVEGLAVTPGDNLEDCLAEEGLWQLNLSSCLSLRTLGLGKVFDAL